MPPLQMFLIDVHGKVDHDGGEASVTNSLVFLGPVEHTDIY